MKNDALKMCECCKIQFVDSGHGDGMCCDCSGRGCVSGLGWPDFIFVGLVTACIILVLFKTGVFK